MRVFKTKGFAQFCAKEAIDDAHLLLATKEIAAGLIHAPLGSGLFKQRIARVGGGKSGGHRTILVFRSGQLALFIFGFNKRDQDNIGPARLQQLRHIAATVLKLEITEIEAELKVGRWLEIIDHEEDLQGSVEPSDS